MRAFALALALVGCGASDPCAGRNGTCIALTVSSSTLASLDTLRITDGQLMETQTSSAPGQTMPMPLPILLAVTLPPGAAGHVVLHVDGLLGGNVLGSGDATIDIAEGQHAAAGVVLFGTGDMSVGGADLTKVGGDGDGGGDGGGCVPSGNEECFNGIDDDCNGLVDCADPACAAIAQCVPSGGTGFQYGTLIVDGGLPPDMGPTACASTTRLYGNFGKSGPYCDGCTCGFTGGSCSCAVYSDTPVGTCSAATPATNLVGTPGSTCTSLGLGTRITIGSCSCSGGPICGTQIPASLPPRTMTVRQFCADAAVGAGCAAGMVCAPKLGANPACLIGPAGATCPSGYSKQTSWNTDYADQRGCAACSSCSPQNWVSFTSNCAGGNYLVFAGTTICLSGYNSGAAMGDCSSGVSTLSGSVVGAGTAETICCQ